MNECEAANCCHLHVQRGGCAVAILRIQHTVLWLGKLSVKVACIGFTHLGDAYIHPQIYKDDWLLKRAGVLVVFIIIEEA